jgi:hypothetical protein
MESTEVQENSSISKSEVAASSAAVSEESKGRSRTIRAQEGMAPCPTCGATSESGGSSAVSYVYALGRIEARFPRPSAEKEFAQATGRADTKGKTDRQAFSDVLKKRENRYLVRQLCWVFTVQGLETYLLQPRDPADLDLLVEAADGHEPETWINLVIGVRGPIAAPDMCNGLMIPIVGYDQIYSFDRNSLVKSIPRPEKAARSFDVAARELFERIMQMTDNAGATDEHRALNYLAMRYPAVYSTAADEFARDFSLSGVYVQPSTLSGTRNVVDVVFSYTNRDTDFNEKFFVRVDVTEEFPFLVTKMAPYYDR